ncbi:flavodoxin reductase [Pseudooctadecabacter sp.]|uniref:flavodoxin reductase n=1 Tax=Pseudooctadecabacter sp. TaxID=1966338 RepID=UPI0035C87EA7
MTHDITLRDIRSVTPSTHHLVFDKPEGFTFTPGQATDMAVLKDGWEDEKRPFTFTSFPDDPHLEFVIKSYPDHDGVTEQIGQMVAGDKVRIGDPWGAIADKGRGVFFAGGTGITPFIPILRQRARIGSIAGCTLVLAATTEDELILKSEWDQMDGLETVYVLSNENKAPFDHGRICLEVANEFVAGHGEGDHMFYICGPDGMVKNVRENLTYMGVSSDRIVTEG